MEVDQGHTHICKFCPKSFSSGKSMANHTRVHEHNSKTQSECPNISSEENHCKVCNKGFVNIKALYGHMKKHSKTERTHSFCKECGKGFVSAKALSGHMRCHSAPMKKRGSRTGRYKSISNSLGSGFNSDIHNDVTDDTIVGNEVEEVAMILITMSMGSVDSIREHKWPNIDKYLVEKGGECLVFDEGFVLNSNVGDDQVSDNGDLASKYDNGEMEETVDGLLRIDELEKPHLGKMKEEQSSDRTGVDAYDYDMKSTSDASDENSAGDKCEYKCTTCYMIFSSYQALGGHRSHSHRAAKSSSLSDAKVECANPKGLVVIRGSIF